MYKIWICGSEGQIGKSILKNIDKDEFEVFTSDKDIDVTNNKVVTDYAKEHQFDIIVNCTGLVSHNYCNEHPQEAFSVNSNGARNLAIAASLTNAKIVYISTDDVFDGKSSKPYREFDETHPKSIYGKSKLAGEDYTKDFSNHYYIIRSSWVYGEGKNFVTTLIDTAKTDNSIAVAADQFGSPTSANELAKFILKLVKTNEFGTYHFTCKHTCSRFEFAKEIIRLSNLKVKLKAVPTLESDFYTFRPTNVVLDNFMLKMNGDYPFVEWKTALKEFIEEGNHG